MLGCMLDLLVGLLRLANLQFDVVPWYDFGVPMYYNNNKNQAVSHLCCANILLRESPCVCTPGWCHLCCLSTSEAHTKESDISSFNVLSLVFCCVSKNKNTHVLLLVR